MEFSYIEKILLENPNMESYLNWDEISKINMSHEFISKYEKNINWVIFNATNPGITLEFMSNLPDKIDMKLLAKNKNLPKETLIKHLEAFDWDTVQQNQKLDLEFLNEHKEKMNSLYALKHQELSEELVEYFLDKNLSYFSLSIALENQKISENLIERIIEKNKALDIQDINKINESSLLHIVLEKAKLSENFIRTFLYDDAMNEYVVGTIITNQKIDNINFWNDYLKYINEKSQNNLDYSRFTFKMIIMYQNIDDDFIINYFDKNVDNLLKFSDFIASIVSYKNISIRVFQYLQNQYQILLDKMKNLEISENSAGQAGADETFIKNSIDLEALTGKIDKHFDSFAENVLLNLLDQESYEGSDYEFLQRINWFSFSKKHFNQRQINMLAKYFHDKVFWYLLIKVNDVPIEFIETSPFLKIHDKWRYFQKSKNSDFKNGWWKLISDQGVYFRQVLGVIFNKNLTDNNDKILNEFINDVIRETDWKYVLRFEKLDEWYIRLLTNFSDQIDMFWWKISMYQDLSVQFINYYLDRLDMNIIIGTQRLDNDLLEKIIPFLDENGQEKALNSSKLDNQFVRKMLNID